jgi:hypothetical protein
MTYGQNSLDKEQTKNHSLIESRTLSGFVVLLNEAKTIYIRISEYIGHIIRMCRELRHDSTTLMSLKPMFRFWLQRQLLPLLQNDFFKHRVVIRANIGWSNRR